ncbi:MAG: hypothetical protein QOE60_2421, partial [Thermoleophilaceae bacterium]|nr:hypothetical protein [Thermoleophilaceae bacterium]
SGHSGGSYEFPHEVAMAQLREAVNARSSTPKVDHDADELLALLYTGSRVGRGPAVAGSVCVLCQIVGKPEVWRMMDAAPANIDLAEARRIKA